MDYSLLVGIHDCDCSDPDPIVSSDNDLDEDTEDDSPGSGNCGGAPTPPDSPMVAPVPPIFSGDLDSYLEFYAVKCSDREFHCLYLNSFLFV